MQPLVSVFCILISAAYVLTTKTIGGRLIKQPSYVAIGERYQAPEADRTPFEFGPNDKILLNFGQYKSFIDQSGVWRMYSLSYTAQTSTMESTSFQSTLNLSNTVT